MFYTYSTATQIAFYCVEAVALAIPTLFFAGLASHLYSVLRTAPSGINPNEFGSGTSRNRFRLARKACRRNPPAGGIPPIRGDEGGLLLAASPTHSAFAPSGKSPNAFGLAPKGAPRAHVLGDTLSQGTCAGGTPARNGQLTVAESVSASFPASSPVSSPVSCQELPDIELSSLVSIDDYLASTDITELTVKELRSLADQYGYQWRHKHGRGKHARKAEIVRALQARLAPAA